MMDSKLHLIMPMAGGGTRFAREGFDCPKPLIDLQGAPFFYWAARSVEKFVPLEDIIFVVLQEHIDKFSIDKEIRKYYPQAKIVIIPQVLNGAVLTCLEGIKAVSDDKPLLFEDCDHAFMCNAFYEFAQEGNFDFWDGALLTFKSDSPAYSYAQVVDGRVVKTVEKQVVSKEAICGAYYFRQKSVFEQMALKYLEKCTYKEFFMSGVYNVMAEQQLNIRTFRTQEHITFGTPDEYWLAVEDKRVELLK